MFKFILSLFAAASLELPEIQPDREVWATLPLSSSYEHRILQGEGALSTNEYRREFEERGLQIRHFEVEHVLHRFPDLPAFKEWIRCEMAPRLNHTGDERFVEEYCERALESGPMYMRDGTLAFPEERLLVLLRNRSRS